MIDEKALKTVLSSFTEDITGEWVKAKEAWKAVSQFQQELSKHGGQFVLDHEVFEILFKVDDMILAYDGYYPVDMLFRFATKSRKEVENMFLRLYDESRDVYERIVEFKKTSKGLLEKYGDGAEAHFQDELAITTYLWLYNPEKYPIYHSGNLSTVAHKLSTSYVFGKGFTKLDMDKFKSFTAELCDGIRDNMRLCRQYSSLLQGVGLDVDGASCLVTDVMSFVGRDPGSKWLSGYGNLI